MALNGCCGGSLDLRIAGDDPDTHADAQDISIDVGERGRKAVGSYFDITTRRI